MAEVKTFKTPPFRANFTNTLFDADSMDGGPMKYGVMAIWYPERFTDAHKALWKAIHDELDAVSLQAFKKKWSDLPGNFKKGLRPGEEKAAMGEAFEGATFANLTTKLVPGVVSNVRGPDGKPLPISKKAGNTEEVFSGCWMRATITIYSYDNKGKGVALGLMNAQKLKDGPRLDYRGDAAADFADDDEDQAFLDQLEGGDDMDDEIPF